MKYLVPIAMTALVAACSSVAPVKEAPPVQLANPASQFCVQSGGTLRIEKTPAGEAGICVLPNGREIDEWELFRSSQASSTLPKVNVVRYRCEPQQNVTVTYFVDQERAQLERAGSTVELKQQPSGSGFIYSNGPNTIRGKGDDLTLEIGRMAAIQCKAI